MLAGSVRPQVTPEVLRELDNSKTRDKRSTGVEAMMDVQSCVGKHVAEDVRNMPPVLIMDDS